MRNIFVFAVLGFSICVAACTEKKADSIYNVDTKKAEMKVHGGDGTKSSDTVGFIGVVRKQTLPAYPEMTIGKAFDGYSYLTKKEWKETPSANGTIYIDFAGWFQGNQFSVDTIRRGISRQGVEVKFVIKPDGAFSVGMVSRLEATTAGTVNAYPLSDVKVIMDSIYSNKEISFK